MADAEDSKSSAARHGGSSPSTSTNLKMKLRSIGWDRWLVGGLGVLWILILFFTGHADAALMLIVVGGLTAFAFRGV
jgi:hypothetical protein